MEIKAETDNFLLGCREKWGNENMIFTTDSSQKLEKLQQQQKKFHFSGCLLRKVKGKKNIIPFNLLPCYPENER